MGRDGGHAQSNHKPGYMGKKDSGDKKHGEGNKGGHRDRKVNPHSAKGKPFVERLGGYASANKAREESQFDPHTNKPRKLEINFDPEKRNEYLTGFSKRKKVRRQFGLAMQALKDRNERVAERKERREEKEKDQVLWDEVEMLDGKKAQQYDEEEREKETAVYGDEQTKEMFGGEVSVSISYGMPGDSDDDEDVCDGTTLKDKEDKEDEELLLSRQKGEKKKDTDQYYAGNVGKYMAKLEGNLPAKNKSQKKQGWSGKGTHGAAGMKGMKGDMTKASGKILGKFQDSSSSRGKGGKPEKKPRLGGRANVGKKNKKGQVGSK